MKILNSIFKWIKQQFCNHNYETTEYYPSRNKPMKFMYHCKKCGRIDI